VTVNSARPDQLRDHARRLRAAAQRLDEELRQVAGVEAAYRDRCSGGADVGGATLLARSTLTLLHDLAVGIDQVAGAFEAADRGHVAGVVEACGSRLAASIERRSPGLTAGVGMAAEVAHERGRRIGIGLRASDPDHARQALDRLGSAAGVDPHFATGVLQGLGTAGLAHLAARARHQTTSGGRDRPQEERLLDQLAGLLERAAGTVPASSRPTDVLHIGPGGLDVALFHRLGRTLEGRAALRSLVARMRGPLSSAVTVAIADQVLFGSTAHDDSSRPGSPLLAGAPTSVPGEDGEDRALQLLAADPVASMMLELRHRGEASPAVLLVQRDRPGPDHAAAGRVLHNVLVESVRRGWATPWADPAAGTAAAYRHDTVPRALDALMEAVVTDDAVSHASPSLATALAGAVATHPQAFTVAIARADAADTDAGRRLPSRFYEAIARDRDALDRVAGALFDEYHRAVAASLAAHPPGHAATSTVLTEMELAQRSLRSLVEGARAAGFYERLGLVLAVQLTKAVLGAGINKVAPLGSGLVAKGVAKAAGALNAEAAKTLIEQEGSGFDGREHDAEAQVERGGAYLGAVAMAADPAWSALLRFPAGGIDRGWFGRLDVGGNDRDHAAFLRWVAGQNPVVTDVLRTLPGGS